MNQYYVPNSSEQGGLMNMNMKVGYSVVDDAMDLTSELDPRLPLLQDAHAGDNLQDKVVLLRVDHNVVKKGEHTKTLNSICG